MSVTTPAGHEIDFGHENIMGPWYNCWSWSAVGFNRGVLEEDIFEVHGSTGRGWGGPKPGSLNFGVGGGVIDWSKTISEIGFRSNNNVEFATCCGIMGWASNQFNPSTYLSYRRSSRPKALIGASAATGILVCKSTVTLALMM